MGNGHMGTSEQNDKTPVRTSPSRNFGGKNTRVFAVDDNFDFDLPTKVIVWIWHDLQSSESLTVKGLLAHLVA